MNKEIARCFVKLIAEDLQFSFNGMGIPSCSCEWLENQLIQGNYDEVKEFIQKRYDEHENASKKKRKFRAMTIREYCDLKKCNQCEYHYGVFGVFRCEYSMFNESRITSKPYKTKDGKYILIEVKE
jgi:hypothetical protein